MSTVEDRRGRWIALGRYPDTEPCEVCGKTGRGRGVIDRHHRDSDRLNNDRANIAFLCRKHHQEAHRQTDGKVGGGHRPRINALHRSRALERFAEAQHLEAAGLTHPEIAVVMGVDDWTVSRWFHKYGKAP